MSRFPFWSTAGAPDTSGRSLTLADIEAARASIEASVGETANEPEVVIMPRELYGRLTFTAGQIAATRHARPGAAFARAFKQEARGIVAFCRAEGRRMWPSIRRHRRAFRRGVRRDLRMIRRGFTRWQAVYPSHVGVMRGLDEVRGLGEA